MATLMIVLLLVESFSMTRGWVFLASTPGSTYIVVWSCVLAGIMLVSGNWAAVKTKYLLYFTIKIAKTSRLHFCTTRRCLQTPHQIHECSYERHTCKFTSFFAAGFQFLLKGKFLALA